MRIIKYYATPPGSGCVFGDADVQIYDPWRGLKQVHLRINIDTVRCHMIVEKWNQQTLRPRRGRIIINMANTYTKLYIHLVFAVWGRYRLISERHEEEIYKYMSGIISNKGNKIMIINGMPDHVHILLGLHPTVSISNLVMEVKKSTTRFINSNRLTRGKFDWQEGYGAFSYSRFDLDNVYNYIANQKEHQKRKSFKEEYLGFLETLNVNFNKKYVFRFD